MRREIDGKVNDDEGEESRLESGKWKSRKRGEVEEEANQAPRPEKKREREENLQSKNAERIEESSEDRHGVSARCVRHVVDVSAQGFEKSQIAEVRVVAPIVCPVAEVDAEVGEHPQADEKNRKRNIRGKFSAEAHDDGNYTGFGNLFTIQDMKRQKLFCVNGFKSSQPGYRFGFT